MAYVDAAVWINRFEGKPAYQSQVEIALSKLEHDGWTLCTSEAVLLEVLFKPYRDQQQALIALYHRVFAEIDILANYESLLRDALTIAPKENLSAMDAIHVALASYYGCKLFVSTDGHFKHLTTMSPLFINLSHAS